MLKKLDRKRVKRKRYVEKDDDPQLIGEAMADVLTMNVNSSDKRDGRVWKRWSMITRGVSLIQLRDTFFIRSVMSRVNAPAI